MKEGLKIDLKKLLKDYRVLNMEELQKRFSGRSARSIFRDLKELGTVGSYSHAGKYYTLKSTPRYNKYGLWNYENIGFSKYGTLAATIEHWVNESKAGYTYKELKAYFSLRLENVLLELTKKCKIYRDKYEGEYVYYCADKKEAAIQRKHREEQKNRQENKISLEVVVRVLAEIVRSNDIRVESEHLYKRLRIQGVNVTEAQIIEILNMYSVKKTLGFK